MSDIEKYPASCVAHWSTGGVNCCDLHASALVKLGSFMGLHVPVTTLLEPAACTNCVNEAKSENKSKSEAANAE